LITLPRSVLRSFRAVARRAGLHKQRLPTFRISAAETGYRLQAASADVAVEFRHNGTFVPADLHLPLAALDALGGKGSDDVQLDAVEAGRVAVAWTDGGVPRRVVHDLVEPTATPFPVAPSTFTANDGSLWTALRNAAGATDKSPSRYALNCLCLRGGSGRIDATDGQQILSQAGFTFSSADDILVPAVDVLGCKECEGAESVQVGLQEDWIGFVVGPWLVMVRIQKEGRFPKVDDLLIAPEAAKSQLTLSENDAAFLADVLPRLPCDDARYEPVTLDLNGRVLVRSRDTADGRPTEVELTSSHFAGDSIQLQSNRRFLDRALKLGFRRLHASGPDSPLLCIDQGRRFLWAVLDSKSAIPRHPDPICVNFTPTMSSATPRLKKEQRMSDSQPVSVAPRLATSVEARTKPSKPKKVATPLEQAVALRDALRTVACQANNLVRALKHQKRQTRIVESTLASLKELQKVAG
jgi:hypothetical protein